MTTDSFTVYRDALLRESETQIICDGAHYFDEATPVTLSITKQSFIAYRRVFYKHPEKACFLEVRPEYLYIHRSNGDPPEMDEYTVRQWTDVDALCKSLVKPKVTNILPYDMDRGMSAELFALPLDRWFSRKRLAYPNDNIIMTGQDMVILTCTAGPTRPTRVYKVV